VAGDAGPVEMAIGRARYSVSVMGSQATFESALTRAYEEAAFGKKTVQQARRLVLHRGERGTRC
jgi:hypothetical protein